MKRKAPLAIIALTAMTAMFVCAEERYTVSPGDSLSKIGHQFDVPYRDIMKANQLESHRINVGQILVIPEKTVTTAQVKKPVLKENKAVYPQYDRYRSPALDNPPIEPVDSFIEQIRVGTDSGETPLITDTAPVQKPKAFAIPRHTYPPTTLERYSTPTAPGTTSVSPYNDSPAIASQNQTYTKPAPVKKATSSPPKRGRNVPASAKVGGYMVQPGDSVRSISKRHGITFWQLRSANGLGLKKIHPGQMLKIPGRSSRLR